MLASLYVLLLELFTLICALTSPPRSSWPRVVNGSVEIEAILNSRPMALLHANDTIEAIDLTPGHFIIEKPLKAPPCKEASNAQDYKPEEMDFGKSNSCRISAKVAGVLPPVKISTHQVAQDELQPQAW